jgi:hypothetical protein
MTHWAVFAWAKGVPVDAQVGPMFFAEFPRSQVLAFLQRWLDLRERKEDVAHLRAMVVALEQAEELRRLLRETASPVWADEELRSRLCWYWWGGIFDIYMMYATRRSRLLLGNVVTHAGLGSDCIAVVDSKSLDPKGLSVRLFQFGEGPEVGLMMKAFSHHSSAELRGLESALLADGKLKEMPDERLVRALPLVREALFAARSLWREY